MTEKLAFKSDYWKIKRDDDSHLAAQSFYDLEWLHHHDYMNGVFAEFQDRMSWKSWTYLDCDEGDRWNNRMWGLLR